MSEQRERRRSEHEHALFFRGRVDPPLKAAVDLTPKVLEDETGLYKSVTTLYGPKAVLTREEYQDDGFTAIVTTRESSVPGGDPTHILEYKGKGLSLRLMKRGENLRIRNDGDVHQITHEGLKEHLDTLDHKHRIRIKNRLRHIDIPIDEAS